MNRCIPYLAILLAINLASCGGDGDNDPTDTTTEADTTDDTATDTATDVPEDTEPDPDPDVEPDTTPDADPDVAEDVADEDAFTPSDAAIYFCDTGYAALCGFGTSGRFIDSDVAEEVNMIDVNCRAVLELSHAFGRRLAKRIFFN